MSSARPSPLLISLKRVVMLASYLAIYLLSLSFSFSFSFLSSSQYNLERALIIIPSAQLVSQSLCFISRAVWSGYYKALCGMRNCQGAQSAVSNVWLRGTFASLFYVLLHQLDLPTRIEAETEQFEDDPRSSSGSILRSRRLRLWMSIPGTW